MNKAFWERTAFLYDLAVRKGDNGDREAAEYIAGFLSPDFRLLEAACGTGRFSCELALGVSRVVCCDYADRMVQAAKNKADRLGLLNLDFSVQDITSLEFENGSFDAALAANVLHLLPEPERAVEELVRVVKPGGPIILPNYVGGESLGSDRFFLRFIEKLGFRARQAWKRAEFLDFLTRSGLVIVDHRMFDSRQPLCVAITRRPPLH